jgi:hypothetical protein
MKDTRDPEQLGKAILEIKKHNPTMTASQAADIVGMGYVANGGGNGRVLPELRDLG